MRENYKKKFVILKIHYIRYAYEYVCVICNADYDKYTCLNRKVLNCERGQW